jgi:hypothetical protein
VNVRPPGLRAWLSSALVVFVLSTLAAPATRQAMLIALLWFLLAVGLALLALVVSLVLFVAFKGDYK